MHGLGLTVIVYNHVLRLDIAKKEWELIDNYGDIPCVRMGTLSLRSINAVLLTDSRPHDDLLEEPEAHQLRR